MLVLSRKTEQTFELCLAATGQHLALIKLIRIAGNVCKIGIQADRQLVDVYRDDMKSDKARRIIKRELPT